jgi:hypothetical protein
VFNSSLLSSRSHTAGGGISSNMSWILLDSITALLSSYQHFSLFKNQLNSCSLRYCFWAESDILCSRSMRRCGWAGSDFSQGILSGQPRRPRPPRFPRRRSAGRCPRPWSQPLCEPRTLPVCLMLLAFVMSLSSQIQEFCDTIPAASHHASVL